MARSESHNSNLLIPKIQAAITDPDNLTALITVEMLIGASISPEDVEPIIAFEFIQRTNKETKLYDNQDFYLSLLDFQNLCFASCLLLASVIREMKSDRLIDISKTLHLARHSIQQLSEVINLLEGEIETYE